MSPSEDLSPCELYERVRRGDFVEIRFGLELEKIHRGTVAGACLSVRDDGEVAVRLVFRTGSFKVPASASGRILERKAAASGRRRTAGY